VILRAACLFALAFSLIFCSWIAYSSYDHGGPALLDFAVMAGLPTKLPSIRPPFYILPPWPGVWLAENSICGFVLGWWLVTRRKEPALALLLAIFTPTIISLLVGQDSFLILGVLASVFLLLENKRLLPAGLFLAFLSVKFQLLPAFVLLLVIRREWRALAGFAVGAAIMIFPVLPNLGVYAALLPLRVNDPTVMPCRECMPNLYALVPPTRWAILASVAVLIAGAIFARRRPLPEAFAITCVTALLASLHAHVYDCGLLFLAVALAVPFSGSRARALAAAWAISPLPYLLPYYGENLRLIPALTATTLWAFLLFPREARDGSPPAPDEYRTA
jgi:hypothetical protein